eukprot:s2496_g5.t1
MQRTSDNGSSVGAIRADAWLVALFGQPSPLTHAQPVAMLPELSEHLVSSCNGAQDLAKQIRPDSGGASAGQSFRRASLKRQYFLIVRWAKDLDAIVYLWGSSCQGT